MVVGGDQGCGRGDVNTPPFFTDRFEPVARVALYHTDEMTLHDMLGAAWVTVVLRIHVAKLE